MSSAATSTESDPSDLFEDWLRAFAHSLDASDSAGAAQLFASDSYWKDLLAFTWEHKIFSGRSEIAAAFSATIRLMGPRDVRRAASRPGPVARRRSRRDVIEGYFDFDTNFGTGTAFVRLIVTDRGPVAWILLTTLQELREIEGPGGKLPIDDGHTWLERRAERQAFANRDPQVIVIGAGHAGVVAAARLGQLGVDTLVVEKKPRVGDVWRDRYSSLTLHNEINANHLPYLPFPKSWPLWLSKDQLALWLETYAECMELNVWTSTEMCSAIYSEAERQWTVDLRRCDGTIVQKRCRHVVVATGISGSIPNRVDLPGASEFRGEIVHSSDFKSSADYAGKNVIVVGMGSSGHDIAQDLVANGATSVSMLQRGPTCVISRNPGAAMIYAIYSSGQAIEDVDLVAAAIPYPLLKESYKFITAKAAELDQPLLSKLNERGMKTYFGSDNTGFQMMFMRGQGGYYIDVGCSALIADGTIPVIQAEETIGLNAGDFQMKDGSTVPCDVVVLSTGFLNMQENIRAMFGNEVADKVGPVWGFDEDYQMRAMWRRTGQDGLWITGGSLLDSRIFSRFMALEIKAELEGILPSRDALPLQAGVDAPELEVRRAWSSTGLSLRTTSIPIPIQNKRRDRSHDRSRPSYY
ncbi:MAG: NAD(P)/FAD-dependent oxidoreductase [Novosphingobium sp.]|nr:NAD(P)/FAD-dependent oxidoreductase [Novosphingobium sp.]